MSGTYISKEQLRYTLYYFGEIAFSKNNPSGRDFLIPSSGDRFIIKRTYNENFEIHNDSPKLLYVDSYKLAQGESIMLDTKSVFIYNNISENDDSEHVPFIFGFDPCSLEMWQLTDEDRGCSVEANNFSRIFPSSMGKNVGVADISFKIRPAEFVGIYGNSGTGKTVLIESLVSPNAIKKSTKFIKKDLNNALLIDNLPVRFARDAIAYLPQHIQFPKNITCAELLKIGVIDRGNSIVNTKTIEDTLDLCALSSDILNEKFGKLSGGQQRRLALALTLLNKKIRLLIADEPTSGLDIANEIEIMRTLRKLSRSKGISVIVVTHAVAALSMFDRVMVLRKKSDNDGANFSFNSLWTEQSFPNILKDSITQDADRISFLSNQNSICQMPNFEDVKYIWPFDIGKVMQLPKKSFVQKTKKVLCSPINWFKNTISRKTIRQSCGWGKISCKLIIRDFKTLINFSFLALFCVIAIQLGVGTGAAGNENIISLMSLCAPWLCATYASLFSSELLSTFAWENFAGLRARSFTLGILFGLFIPCLCISLIFTSGMFFKINNECIVAKIENITSNKFIKFSIVDYFISKEEQADYKEYSNMALKDKINDYSVNFFTTSPLYKISECELGVEGRSSFVLSSNKFHRGNKELKDLISQEEFFLIQWLTLFLICMLGATIGLATNAFFRNVKVSTISLVVLFIAFMVFSRAFIGQSTHMQSIKMISGGQLSATDVDLILPILLSFLCISRYIFNVLCYLLNNFYWLDWIPLLLWWLLAIVIAFINFSNKDKNWKEVSR